MPEDRGTDWRRLDRQGRLSTLFELSQACDISFDCYKDLTDYILRGQPMGHFLTAFVCNDLKQACVRADDDNKYRIWNIAFFLYNHAPMECWGSTERYEKWIRLGGFEGLERLAVPTERRG